MSPLKTLGLIGIMLLCAICVYFLAFPTRLFAKKVGAIDKPRGKRHLHVRPTPTLGGVSICAIFTLLCLIFAPIDKSLAFFLIGGALICALGALDDKFNLVPLFKLAVEVVVSTFTVLGGAKIAFINIGGKYLHLGVLSIPITVLWLVVLTNAINLIDGLDGLALGVSGICALSFGMVAILQGDYACALLSALICGGSFGFLPHNLRVKRKFFMGDAGALFLGFALGYITVRGLFKTQAVFSFIVPVVILGLPIFDTGFAFFRRIAKGKNPFGADRAHLHHRFLQMGFTPRQTVCIFYLFSGVLGIVGIILSEFGFIPAFILLILCALIAFLLFSHLQRRNRVKCDKNMKNR